MSNRLLVLGANGMLGGSIFRYFTKNHAFEVLGTVRGKEGQVLLNRLGFSNIQVGVDASDINSVNSILKEFKPDYVLNCIGIIKQHDNAKFPVPAVRINSLFPHELAATCDLLDAKLIHFSTDCVFSGKVGLYKEGDTPDAFDLYGRSKLLGEIDYGRNLTLRTSIIGHELSSSLSLVDWFLSEPGPVKGFTKAIFSGMPTIYIAEFLKDYVFGKNLYGLYHLGVEPIDKYSLLKLIKNEYLSEVKITPSEDLLINRSLNAELLKSAVGFVSPSWQNLIAKMREEYLEYFA